jgi:hypothetical protein
LKNGIFIPGSLQKRHSNSTGAGDTGDRTQQCPGSRHGADSAA